MSQAPTLVAISQFLFSICRSTSSVNAHSAYRRRTARFSGSTNPCHKARHHVTTLNVSIQGCAGNVTRLFAILKRFFNDLPKRRVDQLHTCNHMFQRKKTDVCANLIIDSNNLFYDGDFRLNFLRPMPCPSHQEVQVPPTKDKNPPKTLKTRWAAAPCRILKTCPHPCLHSCVLMLALAKTCTRMC